jgi:hypothetical protein
MKNRLITYSLVVLIAVTGARAQRTKAVEERERGNRSGSLFKPDGIQDRAGGVHNKSNMGWFFENRGKLYARRVSQGPSGEWPVGSGHEYVYRVNPLVGIPGNVVQGRFTTDEEWEAAYGYNDRDSARIAFSDNPKSWPPTGWIVKDPAGKPVYASNQDSYCVYNDSANTRTRLDLQVNQIGYAFSQKKVRDMLYFTFLVINKSTRAYDSLYFGLYMDLDIGNLSGGVEEWSDDKYDFDKKRQLVTFYDSKGYSREWLTPAGQFAPTGYFGMVMLETPAVNGKQPGITDLHYNTAGADDDLDIDSVMYGIISSAPSLYASSLSPRYFHLGANLPDLHFDDINTIPAAGMDVTVWAGSGPYRLNPGDTLRFVTAWVAGMTVADYDSAYVHCRDLYENQFVITQPPVPPTVTAVPGDRRVTVSWNNTPELSRDPLTGNFDFEGYRLYKSIDRGLHWDQIDRNSFPGTGADPVPLAMFDRKNGLGKDTGLQYSFVDSGLTNGFEYWYSVTAYSITQGGQILESARGNTAQETNIGVASPRWDAIGRIPVTSGPVNQTGTGTAKVNVLVSATDIPSASDHTYEISFAPKTVIQRGNFLSVIAVSIDTVGGRTNDIFSMTFTSASAYRLRNLTQGLDSAGVYTSGQPILFQGLRIIFTDTSSQAADKPAVGDSVLFSTGIRITAAGATVLPLQPFSYETRYATTSGVVVTISRADIAAGTGVTYRDKFSFTTRAATTDQGLVASGLSRVKVVPNPYLISSQYEQEYGTLRREPIRQLKFTNLPANCTIYIFTLDGDRVMTIEHNSPNGTETWDMRAAGGREIAAGVYLYLVKTDTAERIDRFAVIK